MMHDGSVFPQVDTYINIIADSCRADRRRDIDRDQLEGLTLAKSCHIKIPRPRRQRGRRKRICITVCDFVLYDLVAPLVDAGIINDSTQAQSRYTQRAARAELASMQTDTARSKCEPPPVR